MKKIVDKKYLNALLIGVVLLSAQIQCGFASDVQNNLLKMDVYKTSKSGVKVTLYTSHPYKEPIIVNKKNDKEYVIYMPETVSSLTAKPSNRSASDIIQNVDVKTQQGQGRKGYTKVVISTSKSAEITPQVQTLANSSYKMSDSEYKELMSHVQKKTAKQTPPAMRPKQNVVKSEPVKQQTVAKKQVAKTAQNASQQKENLISKTQRKVISAPKIVQKAIQKLEKPKVATKQSSALQKTKQIQKQNAANVPSKKSIQPVINKVQKPQAQPAKSVTQKLAQEPPKNLSERTPKISPQTKQITNEVTPATTKEIQPQEQKTPQNIVTPKQPEKTNVLTKIKHKVAEVNMFYLMALTLLPVLLILLLAKKKKSSKKMNKDFDLNEVDESALTQTVDEKIKDYASQKGDWKETFKSYVNEQKEDEKKQQVAFEQEKSQNIDKLFEDTNADISPIDEDITSKAEFASEEEPQISQEDLEDDFSLDEIFGETNDEAELGGEENPDLVLSGLDEDEEDEDFLAQPDSQLAEAQIETTEDVDSENLVKSSYSISNNSGFYLVDYQKSTSLVGYIGEEIFVLKQFDTKVSGKIYARLSERKGSLCSYMIKVAGYKALVEVGSDKMKVLIEL